MKTIDRKSFRFELKDLAEDGTFTGYASTFGNVDLDGDIVVKGAFARTINSSKGVIPILWQHDQHEPIGVNEEMREDEHGLYVKGRLAIDTELGARTRSLLKMGALKGLSIGYQVIQQAKGDNGARLLKELKLFEYSVVTFPANTDAQVEQIKKQGDSMAHDFNAILAQQQAERDLHEKRWHIERAKDEVLDGVMSDKSLDKPAKIKAMDGAYDGYKAAMLDWHGKMIDAAPDEDEGATPEQKAARKPMAEAMKCHMKAFDLTHQAMAEHHKGIDLARRESYAQGYSNDDKNPPVDPGKKNSDPEELHSLTDELRRMRTRISA